MSNKAGVAQHTSRWLLGHPGQVAALLLLIVVGSGAALTRLKIESGTSIYVDSADPARAFLDQVEHHFVTDEVVFVAYESDDPFSKASLEEVRELGARIKAIQLETPKGPKSLVEEVTSLSTIKDVVGADMQFQSVPLVPENVPADPQALQAIRARAERNPLIMAGLLAKNAPRLAALHARLVDELSDDEISHVVSEVRALVAQRTAQGSPTTFFVTGYPTAMTDVAAYMKKDLGTFIPVCSGLIVVLLLLFTRRLWGAAVAVLNAAVAMLASMGTVALLGTLTNTSTILPPMVMILSVATIVHFYSEFARHSHSLPREEAARLTLEELLVPTFMCELTTAVGLISFATSSIPALSQFGVQAAVAVMVVFATSFLVIALAVRWLGAERLIATTEGSTSKLVERGMVNVTSFALKSPRLLLGLMLALTAFFVLGLTKLKVDHNTLDDFNERTPIRQATEFVDRNFGGASEILVSIRTDTEGRMLDPVELRRIDALAEYLKKELGSAQVTSHSDFVKLMHRGFNDDVESEYRVPDSREQVAQLVLLNGDDRFFDYVDRDYRWARIAARTTEHSSAKLKEIFDALGGYLATNFPSSQGYDARGTGSSHMHVVMTGGIIGSFATSFLLSFLLIFVPIAIAFRSLKAGLMTIPSNVFPVIACLGLMGWLGIRLNIATTLISAIILGIAVDDTIHFIQNMRLELRRHGDLNRAVRETMATKGVGAMWITLIITLGFLVFLWSNFNPTHDFGVLTAFAMVTGVIAEVLLLPPLLILLDTRLGVEPPLSPLPAAQPGAHQNP